MIVAIMQPYFFPYIGYFQLMHAVDAFVFYDDVQYIKRGWVNRNRILANNRPSWLTLPVKRDHQTVAINRRIYALEDGVEPAKMKLQSAYEGATAFEEAYPFVSDLLDFDNPNVASFNINLLRQIALQLGLRCKFLISSEIEQPDGLHGEAKIINLCKTLGADDYINVIGGVDLYDPKHFAQTGLNLSFLQCTCAPTPLQNGEAQLSIIHTIMRAGFVECRTLLDQYKVLNKEQSALQLSPD